MKLKRVKRNIFRGIGARTTISHIIVAVSIIMFASISIFVFMSNYIRNYVQRDLLENAVMIAEMESGYVGDVHDKERTNFYEKLTQSTVMFFANEYVLIDDFSPEMGVYITEEYYAIGSSWEFKNMLMVDGVDQYFLASILDGNPMADIRYFQFARSEIIFAGAPIYAEDGTVDSGVMLMQPLTVFREQMSTLLTVTMIITVVALTVAIAVSIRFSRRLMLPLVEIADGAQRLAEGNYGERIVQVSDDEIGQIANSLNALSSRLRRTIGNLRRERDMLDMMMNGINEGIIAVDWYMNTVHCNEPFLRIMEMKRRPENVEGDSEYGRILKKTMKTNELERTYWTDASGNRLRAVASALHSEEGIVIGAVCLVRDVSEAARLEQLQRDYVANVSHELRTPLTGIRGMVEPLIDGVMETDEEKMDCYNVIYRETIRLEKLIRDMLDMSKLQDGRLSIELEQIELNGIMYDAFRRVNQQAINAGIELNIETSNANGALVCIGNEDRVLQALTVFLDNALSYTPSGGSITLYAMEIGSNMLIGVRDTGCGIEPKDMPYIWERFYKVDKSRMRTKGTGLGLAIAKLVVELMHGEIGVNSSPGEGTDFWFTLPINETEE